MPLTRSDFALLVVGVVIAVIGLAAVAIHAVRRRAGERILLWLGLFAAPYGTLLIVRTPVFQLIFGAPTNLGRFAETFGDLAITVPALLLFQALYGRGWRSSVRWMIGFYSAFAIIAFSIMVATNRPDLLPAAGTGIVLLVPAILLLGRIAGYKPPPLADRRILFFGIFIFFLAFSRDHLLSAHLGTWRPGLEPYGFLALVVCLGYAAARRVVANERQLLSLTEEMRAATQIQASILPRHTPRADHLRITVRYAPMTAVAGDFYDFLTVAPGRVGVLVADVVGHGVPAALVASMVKVAVATQVENAAEPGRVITGLNSILCHQASGQYTTAVYLYLDEAKLTGWHSSAGHPAPLLWRRATQTLNSIGESGLLLGVRSNEMYAETEFGLAGGDRLLVYSDGILETSNPAGESFGDGELARFIKAHQHLDTEHFADRLLNEVLAWPKNGGKQAQADDITLIVIDVSEPQPG